jgi:hypothetical protein
MSAISKARRKALSKLVPPPRRETKGERGREREREKEEGGRGGRVGVREGEREREGGSD